LISYHDHDMAQAEWTIPYLTAADVVNSTPIYPSPQHRTESPRRNWDTGNGELKHPSPLRPHSFGASPGSWVPLEDENGQYITPPHHHPTGIIRDSGYGSNEPSYGRPAPPPNPPVQWQAPPALYDRRPSGQTDWSQDDTLLGHDGEGKYQYGQKYREEDDGSQTPAPLYVPEFMESPMRVHPLRADDYLAQRPPTPSSSDHSLQTYVSKFKRFVNKVKDLPWNPPDRVTADYYPGLSKHTARHLKHKPLLVWRNPQVFPSGYTSSTDQGSTLYSDDSSFVDANNMPHAADPTTVLADEFEDDEDIPRSATTPQPRHTPHRTPHRTPQQTPRTHYRPDQPRTAQHTPRSNHRPSASQPNTPHRTPRTSVWHEPQQQYQPHLDQFYTGYWEDGRMPAPLATGGPRYPDGFVPYEQQHVGYLYGQPIHR